MSTTTIVEKRKLVESIAKVQEAKGGKRKFRVRIIEGDRWGSSGYYSKEMLTRDGPKAFPAGTQMYLDHPSESEEHDRPERSVRDLAAKTTSDPVYETDGLYADIEVYEHMAEVVSEIAEDVGLSIRATATVKWEDDNPDPEGRGRPTISSLIEGISVDFVTRAGAGGKVVELLESAREHKPADVKEIEEKAAAKIEERELTYRDKYTALADVVRNKYATADDVWTWVRDFDDDMVWYEISGHGDDNGTYQEGYTIDGVNITLDDDQIEVVAQTIYVAVTTGQESSRTPATAPPAPANPAEGTPTHKKESRVDDVTIAKSRLQELEEAAKERDALREKLTESETREREALVETAKETRRANVAEAKLVVSDQMHDKGIKGKRLLESLAGNPPLDDDGKVDEKALLESVKETLGEVSAVTESGRTGVRGFGVGDDDDKEVSESDIDKEIAKTFGREVKA